MINTFLVKDPTGKIELFISNCDGMPVVVDLTKEQIDRLIEMDIEIFEVPF